MAVVKADGYGHGAVMVARAALESGATQLAVATVDEGVVLRVSGDLQRRFWSSDRSNRSELAEWRSPTASR